MENTGHTTVCKHATETSANQHAPTGKWVVKALQNRHLLRRLALQEIWTRMHPPPPGVLSQIDQSIIEEEHQRTS